jgi:hypothetical protein
MFAVAFVADDVVEPPPDGVVVAGSDDDPPPPHAARSVASVIALADTASVRSVLI